MGRCVRAAAPPNFVRVFTFLGSTRDKLGVSCCVGPFVCKWYLERADAADFNVVLFCLLPLTQPIVAFLVVQARYLLYVLHFFPVFFFLTGFFLLTTLDL